MAIRAAGGVREVGYDFTDDGGELEAVPGKAGGQCDVG